MSDSNKLKALLKEIKEEINYVEIPDDPETGDDQDTSTTNDQVDTGEYYINPDPNLWQL